VIAAGAALGLAALALLALSGIGAGLLKHQLQQTRIVAVETRGAASLAAAMQAKRPVMLEQINTIANTLGAKQVSRRAYQVTEEFEVTSHIVSDEQALEACNRFLDDHRILVEPACGAALSAVYEPPTALKEADNIVVIVCGGMGVSRAQLKHWTTLLEKST